MAVINANGRGRFLVEEKEILELVGAATELDELDAAVAGRRAGQAHVPQRAKPSVRWWTIGVPVAAAAILFLVFIRPGKLAIREFTVTLPAVRAAETELSITLELNRPAYIRFVLIDERRERWLMPFDVDEGKYVGLVNGTVSFRVSPYPKSDDPRGPARAEIAMVVASLEPAPTPDELLEAIPDPVIPAEGKDQALYDELSRIRAALEGRFDCLVQFARVPK